MQSTQGKELKAIKNGLKDLREEGGAIFSKSRQEPHSSRIGSIGSPFLKRLRTKVISRARNPPFHALQVLETGVFSLYMGVFDLD